MSTGTNKERQTSLWNPGQSYQSSGRTFHRAEEMTSLSQRSIGYSSCCCDKMPDKTNIRNKGFALAQFESSIYCYKGRGGNCLPWWMLVLSSLSLSYSVQPPRLWCSPQIKWAFPLQLTRSRISLTDVLRDLFPWWFQIPSSWHSRLTKTLGLA